MAAEAWRGGVNTILYGMLFKEDLHETNAAITADAVIEYRSFGQGPQVFLDAIQGALATDTLIMTEQCAEPRMAWKNFDTPKRGCADSWGS